MKLRTRLFLVIFAITGTGLYFLMDWMLSDLRKRYLEAVEETLVDTANLLAALIETTPRTDSSPFPASLEAGFRTMQDRSFQAKVYRITKTHVDLRVYVTNAQGVVVFDSRPGGGDLGKDYSHWRDVWLTLQGEYGARTTRRIASDPLTSTLHVAAPIRRSGKIVGVAVVAKPSASINAFMALARPKIVVAAVVVGVAVVLAGWLLSIWLTAPIARLSRYARAVGEGRMQPLPRLGASEVRELGLAFEDMRIALEGRRHVESYVHALTHELKSPLTAVHAAAEILEDDPPAEIRARFVANIQRETQRLRELVDRLLELASLESRSHLEHRTRVPIAELCENVRQDLLSKAQSLNQKITVTTDANLGIGGDHLLLRQAVGNLVLNALEFSAPDAEIEIHAFRQAKHLVIQVLDRGPGVPDWAVEKVWERFWSTPRPNGLTKSSGLGLAFVREVARLHGGTATLAARPGGGLEMQIQLPR